MVEAEAVILRHFAARSLAVFGFVGVIILTTQVLNQASKLVEASSSLWLVARLLVLFVPTIAVVILPVAFLIAVIQTYDSMDENLETAVVQATGTVDLRNEQMNLRIKPGDAVYLGHFSAPAANEPGFTVDAELFQVQIDVPVSPAAEIEEVRWIDPAGDGGLVLAPLTRDLILPFYRASLTTPA